MLLYRFDSCLRRDGIPKTMTSSFGVQTVFTTAPKHYKGVCALSKGVILAPSRAKT